MSSSVIKVLPSAFAASADSQPVAWLGGAKPVRFRLNAADGQYPAGATARVTIEPDPDYPGRPWAAKFHVAVLRNFICPLDQIEWIAGDGPLTLEVSPAEPGQMVVNVAEAAELTSRESGYANAVGLLFGIPRMRCRGKEPDDFDCFWRKQVDNWSVDFSAAKLVAVETGDPDLQAWDAEIPIGLQQPVRGYLAMPRGAAAGSLPAVVSYNSASGFSSSNFAQALSFARNGCLAMDINPHGLLNGQSAEYYEENMKRMTQDRCHWQRFGIAAPETWGIVKMMLRALTASRFVEQRQEWNGRDLSVFGSSMGGAQALAAAGLNPAVNLLALNEPAMCGLQPQQDSPQAWPKPFQAEYIDHARFAWGCDQQLPEVVGRLSPVGRIARTVSYCDMIHFARRIRARTLITAGLVDFSCPATGIAAMLNNLQGPVEFVTYPSTGHAWAPGCREQLEGFVSKTLHPSLR